MDSRKFDWKQWSTLAFFVAASAFVVSSAYGQAFTVRDGTKIIVPDAERVGIARAIGDAANELAANIKESTGIAVKVFPAGKAGDAKGAIFIGEQFAANVGLVPKDLRDFYNVIAEKDGSLYLFGHDRPGRKPVKPLGWNQLILPSVKAVCEFQERFMGVRYLAPGATGCEVPRRDKIEVPSGTILRTNPPMNAGNGRFFTMMYCIANNIFGHGAYKTHGGHIYPEAFPWAKYGKTHPEYYALIGSNREPSQKHNPVICISNPDAKKVIVDMIVREFDEGADVVELGQNDGGEFCECEKCAAFGGPDAKSAGEKFWIFHRDIAEEVYRLRPEKTVQIISYAKTAEPPKTFRKFPPNVMIEMMKDSPRAFEMWRRYEVPRGFSCYIYHWGDYPKPGLTCKLSMPKAAQMARRYLANGVKSLYRCGYGELFGTEGPTYYVFNKLIGNSSLDEDVLFEEYCQAAYGPAARAMKSFHSTLDEHVRGFNKMEEGFPFPGERVYPIQSWLNTPNETLSYIYTPAVMTSMEGYLSRAEKTAGLSAKQARRIALARMEFDYARHLGTIEWLYGAFRLKPTKTTFDPLADAILARNAFIDSLYDEKGKMKLFDGWREIRPFGCFGKAILLHNGSLGATLNAPYTWDVAVLRAKGIVPGGPVKEMSASRIAASPKVGDFDTGVFAAAKVQALGGMQLGKVDYSTRFKVGYDCENLYIAVEAELPDSVTVTSQGHDGVCFRQECLELFVDPTFAHAKNFHFIWNPIEDSCLDEAFGLLTDPLDPRFDKMNIDWNGKWKYEVKRSHGVWHSLVTIPFASLGAAAPEKGEKWFLNLGRETYKPGDLQVASWNPSMEGRGLADRESMGVLVFE